MVQCCLHCGLDLQGVVFMNEHIKDLAKLAQQRAEWMTPQGLEWFDNFKEQFTKLIVKECALIAGLMEYEGRKGIGAQILDNFGVEGDEE
jgi:hypothetical protein